MITCPNCRSEQMNGTLYCSECGTDLQNSASPTLGLVQDNADAVLESAFQTGNIVPKQYNAIDKAPPPSPAPIQPPSSGPIRQDLRLLMLNTGRKLDCPDRSNIIIGRGDAITGEMPDIDLASDDALELGVSRRHACITFRDGLPFVTDLGSTNRTFINRQVLMRGQPYAIKDGDEIRMGNAILKIIYKP